MSSSISIQPEQALYFRARRTFLDGKAPDASACIRANLGMQSQQPKPSAFGTYLRTTKGPTLADFNAMWLHPLRRQVVRTWGQRGTLHVYDPADWALVIAARHQWGDGGRSWFLPSDDDVAIARAHIEALDRPITRGDLDFTLQEPFVDEIEPHVRKWAKQMVKGEKTDANIRLTARRFAAGRLIFKLSHAGYLCVGAKQGTEQSYARRTSFFPDLAWTDHDPEAASIVLARRYIASCGPVTVKDIAHFFGAKMTPVRRWVAALKDELIDVACGEREGLLALAADAETLQLPAPKGQRWPTRLLPMWDGHLMMHADKSWTTPDVADQKQVWRSSAVVKPAVMHRGRIVGIWTHKVRVRRVDVTVTPLSGWKKGLEKKLQADASGLARHLDRSEATISLA